MPKAATGCQDRWSLGAVIVLFDILNWVIGGMLLGQSLCHDTQVDAQVCQGAVINTFCSEVSQRSDPSPLDLVDESSISFSGELNDEGIQEPGHLQDLDRDLHIRLQ